MNLAHIGAMEPELRTTPIEYTIIGLSLRHDPAERFGDEIMSLLGRVWPVIKANAIPNDGINRVVYDCKSDEPGAKKASMVFAGVVLDDSTGAVSALAASAGLKRKAVRLARYAYWKHIGPYHLISKTGEAMTKALEHRGLRTCSPMIEVYGHWSSDESKLETETFVSIQ